jgi:hypothetical protein
LYEQTFSGELAGYINEILSGQYLLSDRFDFNINILNSSKGEIEPWFLKIFFEAAKLWKSSNNFQSDRFTFLDAGIGMKLIGLDFAFPLWKNYSVEKNGTGFIIRPDNRLSFNSVLVRIDLTYILKFILEMK